MMKNSASLVLEIIWLATGVICVIAGVRVAGTDSGSKIIIFALMALISFIFAWVRHTQRKKS